MLTLVEKVLLLQEIDIFQHTTSENLSHIAVVTEEVDFPPGEEIFREGELPDAMYVVVSGNVRLHRSGQEVMIASHSDVFGTWALFDDEPRVVTATTTEECRLLRLDKEDFYDLLADHSQITQGVMKTLSMRLRKLLETVQMRTGG